MVLGCVLQHEDAKRLLTKYSLEKNFRLRDTLAPIPEDLRQQTDAATQPPAE
jgi:hypothetical protein